MVRFNPIPWIFAPGVALAGWLYDGTDGAVNALAGWGAIVTLATVWVVVRRRLQTDRSEPPPPG